MAFAFFFMPSNAHEDLAAPLNQFLRKHRVIRVTQQWHETQGGWAYSIEYAEGSGGQRMEAGGGGAKIDYRETLPAEQFAVYARLRELRKALAEREGQPPFAVFTNAQLAEMAQRGCKTVEDLRAIPGVGEARASKFGAAVLALLTPVSTPE